MNVHFQTSFPVMAFARTPWDLMSASALGVTRVLAIQRKINATQNFHDRLRLP